ncbi:MAG: hypothetical protein HY875_06270 [Chloroflexi bacterium]|nr:hypothetical protein [Chloroflexota bacterium]
MRFGTVLALAFGAFAAAFALTACGGSSSNDSGVIAGISYIDGAGLHEMNETIVNTGKIPADAQTVAIRLQTVTLLTDWPGELDKQAKALAALFGEMAKELDSASPDLKRVETAVTNAHDGWHDFSHDVWLYLAGQAKVGGAESHEHQ